METGDLQENIITLLLFVAEMKVIPDHQITHHGFSFESVFAFWGILPGVLRTYSENETMKNFTSYFHNGTIMATGLSNQDESYVRKTKEKDKRDCCFNDHAANHYPGDRRDHIGISSQYALNSC